MNRDDERTITLEIPTGSLGSALGAAISYEKEWAQHEDEARRSRCVEVAKAAASLKMLAKEFREHIEASMRAVERAGLPEMSSLSISLNELRGFLHHVCHRDGGPEIEPFRAVVLAKWAQVLPTLLKARADA